MQLGTRLIKKKKNQLTVLGLALVPKVAVAMTDEITDALGGGC